MAISAITSAGAQIKRLTEFAEEHSPVINPWAAQLQASLDAAEVTEPEAKPDTVYATVNVNGKIVAIIHNSGATETSASTGEKVKDLPSMSEEEQATGPELAKKRAEEIAFALGGKVNMAKSAKTQAQWESGSTESSGIETRYHRIHKDAEAQAMYDVQRIAHANEILMDEFFNYMEKSLGERIRDQILKSKGLTEDDVAAMSPEKREALEKEIAQIIEDKIREGVKKAMRNPEAVATPLTKATIKADTEKNKALLTETAKLDESPVAVKAKKAAQNQLKELLMESKAEAKPTAS